MVSGTTPIAAGITYTIIRLSIGTLDENKESYVLLAACLLVSAGTFLYVATIHVMAEAFTGHSHMPGIEGEKEECSPVCDNLKAIALILVGATIPFLLTVFLDDD